MKREKRITIRIPQRIYQEILKDLRRPHSFAAERVGFLSTGVFPSNDNSLIITATKYTPVKDEDYIDDPSVGAAINENAIHSAMKRIFSSGQGCLHIHLHNHLGRPGPSSTDMQSLPELAEAFHSCNTGAACGFLILSKDSFRCYVTTSEKYKLFDVEQMTIVGSPMKFCFQEEKKSKTDVKIYDRQSFLGMNAQYDFSKVRIGLAGLGGGGSHIAQQLAHIGFTNITVFDNDYIEDSNLNRLIGGWFSDLSKKTFKTKIIERMIRKINPKAKIELHTCRWQEHPEELQKCDIVVGCVDSINERTQLEAACRRALIPLIDIGMDVHQISGFGYAIGGQIILSMPGHQCMRCMKFITDENMEQEAKQYGNAGGRPQVIWPNGVLASTAVGIVVDLITGWSQGRDSAIYLCYDGNNGHIASDSGKNYWPEECKHFLPEQTGEPIFKKL